MVPKIQSVVEDRDRKIADDLAAAQSAREEAEAAEEAYRERIDASRSEALKVAQEAKTTGGSRYREASEDDRRKDRHARRRSRRDASAPRPTLLAASLSRSRPKLRASW